MTTLIPIAAAPATPPPRAFLRLASKISCVVGGAFAGEKLELDMAAAACFERTGQGRNGPAGRVRVDRRVEGGFSFRDRHQHQDDLNLLRFHFETMNK